MHLLLPSTTPGTALRSMVAELVCSPPSLHLLSLSVYLTELYPARHVQPLLTTAHSQVDEVVQSLSVLIAPGFRLEGQKWW